MSRNYRRLLWNIAEKTAGSGDALDMYSGHSGFHTRAGSGHRNGIGYPVYMTTRVMQPNKTVSLWTRNKGPANLIACDARMQVKVSWR